jgi:serine/threonine-protein kinase
MGRTFKCSSGHEWEDTWGDDISLASGQIVCPVCGDRQPAVMPATIAAVVQPAGVSSVPTIGGPVTPRLPEKIEVPGFEILGELGRGGMGVVYKARHLKLKRLVALKMLLAGSHASESGLTRFQGEAEAVARLKHPNIVQVYDISEHEGRPYFSMEFVEGGSLSGKTSGDPQPLREAAQMVATLAEAMHYAHENEIIHRDLKPANVLLTREGQPKITDFGLAKQLDDTSHLSQTGDVMGTPSYMAPEQAAGRVKQLGPPADVWALGAVLYELLTGRPPFKSETPMDTLLQVLYADPVPPSFLRAKLPCDLETICMKCLEKDQARRYASARALAEDLQRYLKGEPIVARPVGGLVRSWKWIKRHPTVAASLAVTLLALVVVIGVVSSFYLREAELSRELKIERDRAREAEAEAVKQKGIAVERSVEAEENFQDAMAAVKAMLTDVGRSELANVPLMETVREELLGKALKFQQRFLGKKSQEPTLRRQTGQAYRLVGDIHAMLGHQAEAEKNYRDGIDLQRQLQRDYPDVPEYREDVALTYFQAGQMYRTRKQLAEAESAFREALQIQDQLAAQHAGEPRYRQQLAQTWNERALVLLSSKRDAPAGEAYAEALRRQEQLVKEYPDRPEFQEDLAGTHNDLGRYLRAAKEFVKAEEHYIKARDLFLHLADRNTKEARYRRKLAAARGNLGNVLRDNKKPKDAQKELEAARDLLKELRTAFPSFPLYRFELASASVNLAAVQRIDCLPDAQKSYEDAEKELEALTKEFPTIPDYKSRLGAAKDNLADVLVIQDDVDVGRKKVGEAIAWHKAALDKNPDDPEYLNSFRRHYLIEANALLRPGKKSGIDHVRAAEAASQVPAAAPKDPEGYRQAARLLARCILAAKNDKELPKAKQDSVTRGYGKQAVDLLMKGLDKGPVSGVDLKENKAYSAIRDTVPAEFAELLKEAAKHDPGK